MRKTNYIKLYAGGGPTTDMNAWFQQMSNQGGQTNGQQLYGQLFGSPQGNPNRIDNGQIDNVTPASIQGQNTPIQNQTNPNVVNQGGLLADNALNPGSVTSPNPSNPSAFKFSGATGTMDILGGITQAWNGINNASSLSGAQKTTMVGDSVEKGIASGLSAFGPWGAVAGAALNVVNGIGGSLMNNNQTAKAANAFTINNDVQQSGSYGGVASAANTAKLDGQAYRKAGLFGKIATNAGQLDNQFKTSNAQQNQAAGIIGNAKQSFKQQAGSIDMYNTQRQQRDFNTNTWNSGQATFGRSGGRLIPKAKDGIHIKKENVGKFTATKKKTGETTEELTHSSNPVTKKRAIFAQNASHWSHKHQAGGKLTPTPDPAINSQHYINSYNATFNNNLSSTTLEKDIAKSMEAARNAYPGNNDIMDTYKGQYDALQDLLQQKGPAPMIYPKFLLTRPIMQQSSIPTSHQAGGQLTIPNNYQSNEGMQIPYDYQPRLGVSKNYMSGYSGGFGQAFSFAQDSPFSRFLSTLGGAQKTSGQFSPGLESTQQMASTSTRNIGYMDSDDVDYLKGQRDSFDQQIKSQAQPQAPSAKGLTPNLGIKPIQGVKVPVGQLGGSINNSGSNSTKTYQEYSHKLGKASKEVNLKRVKEIKAKKHQQGGVMQQDHTAMVAPDLNNKIKNDPDNGYTKWLGSLPQRLNETNDYDLRGYFNKYGPTAIQGSQHLTDEFKKPNHVTFSNESVYNDPEHQGGEWRKADDGKWEFLASPYNVNNVGIDSLQTYFKQNEPNSRLILPSHQQGGPLNVNSNLLPTAPTTPQFTPNRPEWNSFVDWMGKTYPKGVQDTGADPTPQIVSQYKQFNPNTTITPDIVKNYQQDLQDYNNKWKTLQPNYHPQGSTLSAPSPVDNRIGSITSREKYPVVQLPDATGKMIDFGTNIDDALKQYQINQGNATFIDPNLTPTQRFQQNQKRRAQGLQPMTINEHNKLTQSSNQVATNKEGGIMCGSIALHEEGGPINVIPDGAFHSRKHDLKETPHLEDANITLKGIPVVSEAKDGDVIQNAEVEREEIILHYDLTKKLEELHKEDTDESAIKAGKLLAKEIVKNTRDNTGKFELKKK